MTMKTIASKDAQNNFGAIADLVKAGEEVTITQHGKPTMIIFPYKEGLEALRNRNANKMIAFLDSLSDVKEEPALTIEDINALVHEFRQ
jgi:prevent-host-death family protein